MTPTPSTHELNLLASIPYQLGYRPTDSVVLVSVRESGQCGLMVRADLHDIVEAEEHIVSDLVEHLYRDGAVVLVAVVYSDDDVAATANGDGISALTAKAITLLDDGCRDPDLVKTWLVGEHEFTDLDLTGPWPIATDRHAIDALSDAPIAADLVLSGRRVADDREQLGRLPDLPDDAELVTGASPRIAGEGCEASLSGVLALWREVLDRGPMTWPAPEQLLAESEMWRLLAEGVHDVETRDAMIVDVALPMDQCSVPLCAYTDADAAGRAMAGMLDTRVASVPDRDRVQRAIVALEIMASFTAPALRGPALTLLAMFAWWTGHGSLAWVRLDQVADVDQDYRLARLVESAVSMGIPPAWLAGQPALHEVGNT